MPPVRRSRWKRRNSMPRMRQAAPSGGRRTRSEHATAQTKRLPFRPALHPCRRRPREPRPLPKPPKPPGSRNFLLWSSRTLTPTPTCQAYPIRLRLHPRHRAPMLRSYMSERRPGSRPQHPKRLCSPQHPERRRRRRGFTPSQRPSACFRQNSRPPLYIRPSIHQSIHPKPTIRSQPQ